MGRYAGRIFAYCTILTFLGLCGLGVYAKHWESNRAHEVRGEVTSIEPYYRKNDLNLSSRGNRIKIAGCEGGIDVPKRFWDETIEEGDSVTATVEPRFFGGSLRCIEIDDGK